MNLATATLRAKIVEPVVQLLKQGLAPRELAICIALGAVLGVTPVLGSTTILCFVAALSLRLNLVALQIVNYAMYPLQIALILPFIRAGEWLFNAERLPLASTEILGVVSDDPGGAMTLLWSATIRALAVWGLSGLVAGVAIYLVVLPILVKTERRLRRAGSMEAP